MKPKIYFSYNNALIGEWGFIVSQLDPISVQI